MCALDCACPLFQPCDTSIKQVKETDRAVLPVKLGAAGLVEDADWFRWSAKATVGRWVREGKDMRVGEGGVWVDAHGERCR